MISKFFIERPVLANVLAIVIVLIGSVSLFTLPVAQYPNIVPPTVQVTTNYPGASAMTIINEVALPVELQVNGVEGMIYMQSTSTDAGTWARFITLLEIPMASPWRPRSADREMRLLWLAIDRPLKAEKMGTSANSCHLWPARKNPDIANARPKNENLNT